MIELCYVYVMYLDQHMADWAQGLFVFVVVVFLLCILLACLEAANDKHHSASITAHEYHALCCMQYMTIINIILFITRDTRTCDRI